MSGSSPASPLPFNELAPDTLLDALEQVGLAPDGRLLPLNSYENRVYLVGVDSADEVPTGYIVAKFYRPARWRDAAILEEHAFSQELADAEIPVVAPLNIGGATLHHHAGFRFAVFPRRGGRAPELGDPATLTWLGRFLGRIHAVGACRDFVHRPTLDIETFGCEPRQYLLDHGFIPHDLLAAWTSTIDMALDGVRRCFDRAGNVRRIRLHGDCHAGNILWTDDGPHFVDFDDARIGPAVQDLWMLLSGERSDMQDQLTDVLVGYEDFMEFDPRELHLVEPLRTLRLIHYAGWIARRWQDPAFPSAFPWFNTQRYWQDRILELREQIALMDEPPLVA